MLAPRNVINFNHGDGGFGERSPSPSKPFCIFCVLWSSMAEFKAERIRCVQILRRLARDCGEEQLVVNVCTTMSGETT